MQSIFRLPDDLMEHLPGPAQSMKVWVVGGALRDHLLGRSYEDLDFAIEGNAIELARTLANQFSWDFYVLDGERCSARILPKDQQYPIRRLDFAQLRGSDIEEDLSRRDFTINALGFDVHETSTLIDPTGGVEDLRLKRLRACGPDSLRQDPVRVIRVVRFATELGFSIHPDTTVQLKDSVGGLQDVSIERTRDELFRVLDGKHVSAAVSLLDHMGIFEAIFPDLAQFKLSVNGGSGDFSAWRLRVLQMRRLSELVHILGPEHDSEAAADAIWGSVSLQLGRFREPLSRHLQARLSGDRLIIGLLYFVIIRLQRDRGGEFEFEISETGSDTFIDEGSEECSIKDRACAFRLSRMECDYIGNVSRAYRALESLVQERELTDLEVHRYYQSFGEGGVGAALLFLSHVAAKSAGPPEVEIWEQRLKIVRALWDGYFERYREIIAPEPLVDGLEIMQALEIDSGPQIGALLRAIREAQVTRQIHDREEAIALAKRLHSSDRM
jgi:tRNA nucleotidyltransferase/poly(A) polymerase